MPSRIIESDADLETLIAMLRQLTRPFTNSWVQGRDRTGQQNRLQRLWCNEVAEQLGDQTAEDVRGFCKLTMGVPILRAEDDEFCQAYDTVVKPLPYEAKIACMKEPIDFPVTRRMKVKQHVRFLDEMHRYWTERGLRLTEPDSELAAYQSRYRDKPQARAA